MALNTLTWVIRAESLTMKHPAMACAQGSREVWRIHLLMLGYPETFCRMSTSFRVASRSSCTSSELKLPPPVTSMILTAYSWHVGLWMQRLTTLLTPLVGREQMASGLHTPTESLTKGYIQYRDWRKSSEIEYLFFQRAWVRFPAPTWPLATVWNSQGSDTYSDF